MVRGRRRPVTDVEIAAERARNAAEDRANGGAGGNGPSRPGPADPSRDGRYNTFTTSGGEGTQLGFLLGLDGTDRNLQVGRYSRDLEEFYTLNGGGGLLAHVDDQARFLGSQFVSGQDRVQAVRTLQGLAGLETASDGFRAVVSALTDRQVAFDRANPLQALAFGVGRFSYNAVGSVVAPVAQLAGDLTFGTYNDAFAGAGQRIGDFSVKNPINTAVFLGRVANGDPTASIQLIQAGADAVGKLPGYAGGIATSYERYGLAATLNLYSGDLGTAAGTTASLFYGGGEIAGALRTERIAAQASRAAYATEIDAAAVARLSPSSVRTTLTSPFVAAERAPLTGVRANQLAGLGREALARAELDAQFPGASVQNEVYLRSANGKRALDPLTGEGRRIDSVVLQDGRALDSVEVTSQTANKAAQIAKEMRLHQSGGTFVRNRATGNLIDISQVPTRLVRKK